MKRPQQEQEPELSVASVHPTSRPPAPFRAGRSGAPRGLLLLLVVLLLVVDAVPVLAATAANETPPPPPPPVPPLGQLWDQAVAARDADKPLAAAILFQRLYENYPDAPQAEESTWQAAVLAKKNALTAKEPHWRYVRDLFWRYTIDYPKSPRYQEAYFEEGVALYNMHLFREALIYFNLFLKRFPTDKLVPQVRYWQGQTFLRVERLDDATEVFEELSKSPDAGLRLRGFVGLGDALYAGKQYLAALAAYQKVLDKAPRFYFEEPSLLFKLGLTYFRVGNDEQGQRQLFHYLNLEKTSPQRAEALFEVGESYHRLGDDGAALRFYEMAEKEGAGDSRPVVMSRFRRAQYRDAPQRRVPEWRKPEDLSDPKGDAPYQAVLNSFYHDPLAQEARLGLMRRYQARKDEARLFEVAVNFIQNADPDSPQRLQAEEVVGDILVHRVEAHLDKREYQEIFDLYRNDYRHVRAYRQGRLLYLIGQAFEALTLDEQAAVVYYRALALPLDPADKIDLYYRRARVYLQLKDWVAADRLLTYLRKIYGDDGQAMGEIFYLSGRLAAAQGKTREALDYYRKTVAQQPVMIAHRPQYAEALLGLLFETGQVGEVAPLLHRFTSEGWLGGEQLQGWYGRLGDGLHQAGDEAGAMAAYRAGLGEGLPTSGATAQSLQLGLGEALARAGKDNEARKYFGTARSGPDKLLSQVAAERLNGLTINAAVFKMGGVAPGQ